MNWLYSTSSGIVAAHSVPIAAPGAGNQRLRAHAITTTWAMPMKAQNQRPNRKRGLESTQRAAM
jgi:hypothetical protein